MIKRIRNHNFSIPAISKVWSWRCLNASIKQQFNSFLDNFYKGLNSHFFPGLKHLQLQTLKIVEMEKSCYLYFWLHLIPLVKMGLEWKQILLIKTKWKISDLGHGVHVHYIQFWAGQVFGLRYQVYRIIWTWTKSKVLVLSLINVWRTRLNYVTMCLH